MNDFYVYAWLRPCGTPFYIGKGRGKRDRVSARNNPIFINTLRKIERAGEGPVVIRLHEGLTEGEAFDLERIEIAKYGRKNNGTGILANLTDGGEGPSGYRHSEDARAKIGSAHRGRPITPERLAKLVASKNKPAAKIAAAETWSGRAHSQESLEKMAAAQRMKPPIGAHKGIHRHLGRWRARITVDGKPINIGVFAAEEDAARAYDAAAIEAWGVGNCYLNYPDEANSPPPSARSRSEAHRMMGPKKGAYKGVFQPKGAIRWQAKIYLSGKSKHLGGFPTQEEAARAYDKAAIDAWGLGNCWLNFPAANDNNVKGGAAAEG
jgi:hypothetical protein